MEVFPRSSDSIGSVPTIGLDIGGTKCAVSHWAHGRAVEVLRVPTRAFAATFPELEAAIASLPVTGSPRFGISCGGPLDPTKGKILSPPNLPADWHGVAICEKLTRRFGGRANLMNDANACSLAEWQFGAGRGCQHLVFLTSGTGMGAGLILNGRLYAGATGDAGEIGHVRLRAEGPVGFGKAGSVEGFTSGGGIARLAEAKCKALPSPPGWATGREAPSVKTIAAAAQAGDPLALEIMREAGEKLGETLALLIDLFNPERIVIGGFFLRCQPLLAPAMRAALARETLPVPLSRCLIVPAELGDAIGSYGAIAAALYEPA